MNRDKAEFFDRQVGEPWAADEYGAFEKPKIERLIALGELGPGQLLLEPGCGTGRMSQVLARVVGPAGRVVSLDISQAMVQACRLRVADLPQVQVRHAALEDLPIPTPGYDRIICHQVFPHFDDQEKALSRMRRMLKPGGLLLVVHFVSAAEINDTHRKAGTAVAQDMLPSREDMRRLMQGAGLALLSLSDDQEGYFLKARREDDNGCIFNPNFGANPRR
jgi:demethylmenaquinone methyltransferase/2-methoxy-6-polyprenyl-1,4-benzoquinol methylase